MRVLSHAHTTYSGDGELTPGQLAALAAERGFQAVLLSDHFEDLTAESFARLVSECGGVDRCLLVPGYERDWRGYHVLAFGVSEWFDDASIEAWASRVRGAGGLVVAAHPGRYGHEIPDDILAVCDGVEVWNSKRGYDGTAGPNPRAYRLLGACRRPYCGQDLHGVRHASGVALELTVARASPAVILEALRQGNYRMTNGSYGFGGALSGPTHAVLSLFHGVRGRLLSVAIRLVKRTRRARRAAAAQSTTR